MPRRTVIPKAAEEVKFYRSADGQLFGLVGDEKVSYVGEVAISPAGGKMIQFAPVVPKAAMIESSDELNGDPEQGLVDDEENLDFLEIRLRQVKTYIERELERVSERYRGKDLLRAKRGIVDSSIRALVGLDYKNTTIARLDGILAPLGYTFEEAMELLRRDT
jgi:hypothetical protein